MIKYPNADTTKDQALPGSSVDKTIRRSSQRKIKISLLGMDKNQIQITGSQEELNGQALETLALGF